MDTTKLDNKMAMGGVAKTPLKPKASKLARYEVLVDYPGYKKGDIVEHNPNARAVIDNVNKGYWKKL